MEIALSLLFGLLKMFLPALFSAARPTAEDGAGVGEIERRLRAQIKKEGWDAR